MLIDDPLQEGNIWSGEKAFPLPKFYYFLDYRTLGRYEASYKLPPQKVHVSAHGFGINGFYTQGNHFTWGAIKEIDICPNAQGQTACAQ